MKEQDFRARLQHLYGDIPEETHLAFMQAVTGPKREKEPMSVPRLRLLPILLLLIAMLTGCTAAYAASPSGLFYFYHTITSVEWMNEVVPGFYDDVISNLRLMPEQTAEENDIVDVTVTDVSYMANRKQLLLYVSAKPKNPDKVEVYPDGKLNVDGEYGDHPENGDRLVNWLWTDKGCGPVLEQVKDPSKDIWFISVSRILVDETNTDTLGSFFPINGPNGTADYWYEIDFAYMEQSGTLDSEEIEHLLQQDKLTLHLICYLQPYEKETDTVVYPGIEKTLTVTIDLTPKSPKEF